MDHQSVVRSEMAVPDGEELWLRLTYSTEVWRRYLAFRRPPLNLLFSSILLFTAPIVLLALWRAPFLLARGDFIVLALAVTFSFSLLLFLNQYIPYRRLQGTELPYALLRPAGYALSPFRWRRLLLDDYRYSAQLQHELKGSLDVIVLSRRARINYTSMETVKITIPIEPDHRAAAEQFVERFNVYHRSLKQS